MSRGTAKDVADVVAIAGDLVGRTRLQKTVALLEMAGVGYGFEFEYYKYGPYSEDLSISLDRAVDLRYVQESQRLASWGGRYSEFRPTVRPVPATPPARQQLVRIAREADSVALELAVTAAFLARQNVGDAWNEVARRKPEKASFLPKAKLLYRQLLQVAGLPQPLPLI